MSQRVPDAKVVAVDATCPWCQRTHEVEAKTPWLALYEKDGYVFSHSPKWKGVAVAIIPFRKKPIQGWYPGMYELEFLGRHEARPCHGGEHYLSSITGAYDNSGKFTLEECVLNELAEEAGYVGKVEDLIPLGTVNGSKSSDGIDHLFAIEIKEDTPTCEADGDGSAFEQNCWNEWVDFETAIQAQDMIFVTLVSRLKYKLRHK